MFRTQMIFKRRRQALTGVAVLIMISLGVTCVEAGIEWGVIIPLILSNVIMLTLGFIIGSYFVLEHIAKKFRDQRQYDCKTLFQELYNIDEEELNKKKGDKKDNNNSSKKFNNVLPFKKRG